MQILKYILIEASFNSWSQKYIQVANKLIDFISTLEFEVIHIGSTSFKVGGKGIIDLSILYENNDLAKAIEHLVNLGFQNQTANNPFPKERPRKDGMIIFDGEEYLIHIHVIKKDCDEHKKQIYYKNHMLKNPDDRKNYEFYKKQILSKGFKNQEIYGKEKSNFVKSILKNFNQYQEE